MNFLAAETHHRRAPRDHVPIASLIALDLFFAAMKGRAVALHDKHAPFIHYDGDVRAKWTELRLRLDPCVRVVVFDPSFNRSDQQFLYRAFDALIFNSTDRRSLALAATGTMIGLSRMATPADAWLSSVSAAGCAGSFKRMAHLTTLNSTPGFR